MTKLQTMAEKVLVTIVEGAVAFATVTQFSTSTPTKVGTAGVIAGAISLLYNYFREAEPTLNLPPVPPQGPTTPTV